MPCKRNLDIEELLLEAHRKGVEQAIDLSARTGIPLVVEENGKIKRIKPNPARAQCCRFTQIS